MNIPGNTALSDEDYAAQMDRVHALLERWQPLLGFGDWDVQAAYSRLPLAHDGNSLSKATEVSAMTCAADWRYMHMLVSVDAEEAATTNDLRLEFRVVHELMHAVLNECRQPDVSSRGDQYDWLDHEEHAATFLAKAFLRVAGAGVEAAPKTEPTPALAAALDSVRQAAGYVFNCLEPCAYPAGNGYCIVHHTSSTSQCPMDTLRMRLRELADVLAYARA